MQSEIYLVLSGKGGVGKTTVFSNLATALAMMGKETYILDADLAMANLGLAFGLDSTPVTLHEVLAGEAALDGAIYECLHGVKVIPAGLTIEGFRAADPAGLVDVIEYLKPRADYVLVDTPLGVNEDIMLVLPLADHIVIVATPDLPSMADALRMKIIVESFGKSVDGVILNRANMLNVEESKKKLEQTLELKIIAVIPDDVNVHKSALETTPLVASLPNSPASLAIRHLAANITGIRISDSGNKTGFFQKILGILGFKENPDEGQDTTDQYR